MTTDPLSWNVLVSKHNGLPMVCIQNIASNIVIPCECTLDEDLESTINKTLLYCIQLHRLGVRWIAVELRPDARQRLVSKIG